MQVKDDLKLDGLVLPNIPVKIIRQGERLKITAGDYTLELKEMPDLSQTYPLLLLEKFCREVTTKLLQEEIDRRNNRAAAKKSLEMLGVGNVDLETDRVIEQIHNMEFGGQE